MKLVHWADSHLGFRQFERTTAIGVNRREADVEDTFHRLIDQVIPIAPDIIIIGGDVFHSVRPTNHAIVNAIQEFQRLVRALPSTRIVLVAGNHDSPRSTETGGILGSFAPLGIHIVATNAARIEFDDISLSVLAIPEAPGVVRPKLEPQAGFKYNVMVMHGEVQGMPGHHDREKTYSTEVPTDEMHVPEWNYIGLGHYHVYHDLAPNMFYSGSIDYTSSNPWGEMLDEDRRGLSGKGFVERDLDTGAQTFHPLTLVRPYLDLPTFSALDMTSAELDAAIRAAVDATHIEGFAARLVVTEVTRDLARAIDQKAIKEYQRRALNFAFVPRRPEVTRVVVSGAMRQGLSVEDRVRRHFENFTVAKDIDKTALIDGALSYLSQTEDAYAVATPDDHSLADLLSATLEQNAA
ncbi:MAG TPA: metallophosphoesterase [Polyangia bacterium]|nr:metallophosphoesterase [Polyangia bacterium]